MATSDDEELLKSSGKFYFSFREQVDWDGDYDFSKLMSFKVPEGKAIGQH